MKNNIVIILILLGVLGFPSCNIEESLETIPTGTISELIFWEREKDAELAVNAAYRELDGHGMIILDAVTDIAMHSPSGPQTLYDVAVGTLDPTNTNIRNYWRQYWRGIRKANDPINNIDRIEEGNQELLARLKAEARFLRAYYYTQLTNLWGDVPLVLEPLEITDKVSRTKKEDVVDFIIKELDDIINSSILPLSYSGEDIGRATHGAALALKARVALFNERFVIARDAAKAVMDLEIYEIYPNYEELFWYPGQNSNEVIFDRQYAVGFSTHNPFIKSAASLGGSSTIDPIRHYVELHEKVSIGNSEDPYEGLDPRFGYNTFYPGQILPTGDTYNSLPTSTTADRIGSSEYSTQYGFNVRKYIDYERDGSNPDNSTLNFILIRYAEVLLMYAEAKIELNDIDQSVYDAINKVRERPTVEMPLIIPEKTQEELREILRRERTVEFAWEGMRLFDMNRWKIGEAKTGLVEGIEYKNENGEWVILNRGLNRRFRADRDYLWPIPQEEVEVNPNIGQNPNY